MQFLFLFSESISVQQNMKVLKLTELGIWSHLLKKSLMENFIFCAADEQENDFNSNRPIDSNKSRLEGEQCGSDSPACL